MNGDHSLIIGWTLSLDDDVTESPMYLIGEVACGFAFPQITMARDFADALYRHDTTGAALMSLGYLGKVRSLLGTTNLMSSFVGKVIAKDPDIGVKTMNTLWRQGIYHTELPVAENVAMLDKAFDGAVVRLNGQGLADELIVAGFERGANLKKTMNIVESQTGGVQYLWLEEGKLGTAQGATTWIKDQSGEKGWAHIVWNHVNLDAPAEERFGAVFGSNYATEAQVKQLIYDGAKYGIQMPPDKYGLYKLYDVPGTGKQLRVGIDTRGEIISAYPKR